MVIKAKYAGICPCCKEDIAVGSDVEWVKGEKVRHPGCEYLVRTPGMTWAERAKAARAGAVTVRRM